MCFFSNSIVPEANFIFVLMKHNTARNCDVFKVHMAQLCNQL